MKKVTYQCSRAFLATMACLVVATWAGCVSPGNRLLRSAEKGDTENVRKLLAEGVNIDSKNNLERTALVKAAHNGHTHTVDVLLRQGADVTARTHGGATALIHAVLQGHTQIVKDLLDNGADASVAMDNGDTALMHAARIGDVEMVKALLRHGADVNAKARDGWTALMYAAATNVDIVKLLIEHGAETDVRSVEFQTAWFDHSFSGGPNPFRQRPRNRYGETPLSIARRYEKRRIVQLLEDASTHSYGNSSRRASSSDNCENITLGADIFGNLTLDSWSIIRAVNRMAVRDVSVPHVVKSGAMLRVESIPGDAAHCQKVRFQITGLCDQAGYALSPQSPLRMDVKYDELLTMGDGRMIMAPGTGTIVTGPDQYGKLVSITMVLSHPQYGRIRRIEIKGMQAPLDHLAKLWPFQRNVNEFVDLLETGCPAMRMSAARTLGTVFADVAGKAAPILKRLTTNDKQWRVRRAAGIALERISEASLADRDKGE